MENLKIARKQTEVDVGKKSEIVQGADLYQTLSSSHQGCYEVKGQES